MSYCLTEKHSEYSFLLNAIVHLWTEKQRIIFGSCDLHCVRVLFTCSRVSCVSVHFTTESHCSDQTVCAISNIKLGATIRLGNNLPIHKVTVQSYVNYDAFLHVLSVKSHSALCVCCSWSLQWSGGTTLQGERSHAHVCQVSLHLPATSWRRTGVQNCTEGYAVSWSPTSFQAVRLTARNSFRLGPRQLIWLQFNMPVWKSSRFTSTQEVTEVHLFGHM